MIEYFVELCRMLSRNALVSENSRARSGSVKSGGDRIR